MAATPQETIIEDEIREATQLLSEIRAKVATMTKEEKDEQLRSIWDTMKYIINSETGEINDTAREIYEEIMSLLDADEEPPEILTARRVSQYIFLNAQDASDGEEEDAEEPNAEAHSHYAEGMLNVGYYLDNYAANNPTAEAEAEDLYDPCHHGKKWGVKCDECKQEEQEAEAPCHHGKEFHEECCWCRDEAEEADEDAREEEERIERAVEYNQWYRDGGYKQLIGWG
jgi:hypothetical protein